MLVVPWLIIPLSAGSPPSFLSATAPAQTTQQDCVLNPSAPKCIGRWLDPVELCTLPPPEELFAVDGGSIGCNPRADCGDQACNLPACPSGDEIAHASLIPSGPRAGQVILWTRCDRLSENPRFKSYFWNPASGEVTGAVSFPAPSPPSYDTFAFCNGHTWILDGAGKAKLFNVGGSVTNKAYWFDPETVSWSTAPLDLPGTDRNYYPSVVTWGDDLLQQSVVGVIGGTPVAGENICTNLYQKRWTLSSPFTSGAWTTDNTPSFKWFQYPRTLVLSQKYVITAGHFVTCEDDDNDGVVETEDSDGILEEWGGNPVQLIDLQSGAHQDLPNLDPNLVFGDFGGSHEQIKAWHYSNAALLHTLKAGWTWPSDPSSALDRYDLDRVLVFGGAPKFRQPNGQAWNLPAHSVVLELQATGTDPSQWTWIEKARANDGRLTGNWVILPDGNLLAVGGATRTVAGVMLGTAERFDPMGPADSGVWKSMQGRVIPAGATSPTPRLYHSVSLLTPSGEVAVMGGFYPGIPLPESIHTAEVFRPTYCHYSNRPSLSSVPPDIHYPSGLASNTFCVQTNALQVSRACLIGVGSVTHHFDYGQRYVELMVRATSCTNGNVEVFPPPNAFVAPPGYYMLFLVDWRGIPSTGTFVKVTY